MLRKFILGLTAAGFCAGLAGTSLADDRASITKKGSLLVWSKVEIKWERTLLGGFSLTQDTILDLSNDYPGDVSVQFYFVNGDEALDAECDPTCVLELGSCEEECVIERAHPGWNWVDCQVLLTANQPMYMSMVAGQGFGSSVAGCQPFTSLDPGDPPGRPDPDVIGGRVLRGFVVGWAVKNNPDDGQNSQIRWNHLIGDASIINYALATSAEYNAYAFAALEGATAHGDFVGTAGVINLDGVEYDSAYERLLMDFYAADARRGFDFDITLHTVSADLRQETNGPVRTKAVFDIWNEDEIRFSGTEKCITCWDQTLASNYPSPNHLLIGSIHTTKGKARITGIASNIAACPLATDAALLGLQIKHIIFGGLPLRFARSAISMVGQGEKDATIRYDIISGSEEAQDVTGGTVGTAGVSKANGRAGR